MNNNKISLNFKSLTRSPKVNIPMTYSQQKAMVNILQFLLLASQGPQRHMHELVMRVKCRKS